MQYPAAVCLPLCFSVTRDRSLRRGMATVIPGLSWRLSRAILTKTRRCNENTSPVARLLAVFLLTLCPLANAAGEQPLAVLCGRLIDGRGDAAMRDRVVLVEGERITAVGGREIIPKGAHIIDLGDATVLPGLIDAHAHPLIR